MEIGASTRLLTIIGDPVAHSLSPAMHNAACRALGLDATYVALRVPRAALPTVLQSFAAIGGADRDPAEVEHQEDVRERQLELEREADDVEVAQRARALERA